MDIINKKALRSNVAKISYKLIQASLLILLCLLISKFSYYQPKRQCQQKEKIEQMKNTLSHLKTSVLLDKVRTQWVRKVVAIIDRFNPEMKEELKLEIAEKIHEMSLKYNNLDIDLICATITHESARSWDPVVVSHAGAMGLMQILPSTGFELAQQEGIPWESTEEILFNPIHNITLGCRYLATLITEYNVDGGLAAYNGGAKRAELWLLNGRTRGILHEETTFYVPSILKIYEEYKHM